MGQIKHTKIVFIVYKAGWWGCFDSLYRKLSQDDKNECYVIPVPYYKRKAKDNTIEDTISCCEADRLPVDIPVTDYNTIDLGELHPDIIYIHNPYDGQGSMDVVDTKYDSYHLKKCTDLLIYIPHMLYLDGVPEQFRNAPVYQNVDRIMFTNKVVANSIDRVSKEKHDISGSPLVDYIEKLSISKPDIPYEWKAMLPNGQDFNGKRVIFYHIGFTELYYGTERSIAKIKYVFDYMQTRKDVVFIWKPDLEIEARLSELPKGIANDFLRLKQRFLNDNLGILDTTEDEAVVAVLSDAYFGDYHPILNLFGLQGKPIYIVDKECRYIPTDDELCSVSFLDFIVEEDKIWFVADEYNLLCNMDLVTGETKVIDEIPNEKSAGVVNFCGIIKNDDKIYLNPFNSEAFIEYDLKKRQFFANYIPDALTNNFDYIIRYKNFIFLKPKKYPAIVRYQTITKEFMYYTDCIRELDQYVKPGDEQEPYFIWGVVVKDNKLMLASSKANIILEFDMDDGSHKLYEVGPYGSKYYGMGYDGENYWLIPYLGKSVVFWNHKTKQWKLFSDFSEEIGTNTIPYRSIIKHKDSILIMPFQANFGVEINITDHCFNKYDLQLPDPIGSFRSEYYQKAITPINVVKSWKLGVILVEAMYDSSIIIIDLLTGITRKFATRISINMVKYIKHRLIRQERDIATFPCLIRSDLSLGIIVDFCSSDALLINNREKSLYYSKIHDVNLHRWS